MASVQVNLPPDLLQTALDEAARRQNENQARGLMGRNRAPATGPQALKLHELGAVGEMAVAKYLGLEDMVFSETKPKWGSADLPYDIEVKTRSRHSYDLIVQRRERDDKNLVLVTIERGEILIHGWCRSGDVKREEFWADPAGGRPAYFVSKSELQPIQSLKAG